MDLWDDVASEWRALQNLRYHGLAEPIVPKGRAFMKLMPHQQKAVDELHNGAILAGEVGVGKTITALTYFYTKVCGGVDPATGTMRTPMDLYVITTAKKRNSLDWQGDAASLGISDERDKSIEAIQLTVDSWNNIGKYTEVKDAFFIFDEQRLVGSGHWAKSFIKIAKHNKWIVLSATPGDTWLDYIPVFVANGFYKNRTEFKREHCVYNTYTKFPKVERYVGVNKLVRHKKAVLVEMPYVRHTVRHHKTITVDHDKQQFEKVVKNRWHVFENRPIRDVAELFHVMRKVVNYDVSRVEEIERLLQKHPKLIVFYNFDYELERLRTLADGSPEKYGMEKSTSRPRSSLLKTNTKLSAKELEVTTASTPETSHPTVLNGTLTQTSQCIPETISDSRRNVPTGTRESKESSARVTTSGHTTTMHSSMKHKPLSFAVAEWNGHKHEPIPSTDSWVYLVQYVAGSEGWNCIETDAICHYSQTYSYKNHHQSEGRIDRLNTPFVDLYYYKLVSDSMIDKAIAKALAQKKNFNEKKFGHFD